MDEPVKPRVIDLKEARQQGASGRPPRGDGTRPRKSTPGTDAKGEAGGASHSGTHTHNAPPAEPTPKRRTPADRKLQEAVAGLYQTAGMAIIGVGMSRSSEDTANAGAHIVNMAPAVSDAWIDLANQNPQVKRYLQKLGEGSATATLIGLHVAMLAPLAAAGGLLPDSFGEVLTKMNGTFDHNGQSTA
jgi:hypothetical protein